MGQLKNLQKRTNVPYKKKKKMGMGQKGAAPM